MTLEDHLKALDDPRREAILAFHQEHLDRIMVAKGSSHNHQAWVGGYAGHITECLDIADALYGSLSEIRPLPFTLASAKIMLYFHDVEKIFKYTSGDDIDNDDWYVRVLPKRGIPFSEDEYNALEYAHGEVHDHSKTERRMGRLAAFVHSCDVLSARMWFDEPNGTAAS